MERDLRVQIIPGPFGVWRRLIITDFGVSHWESIDGEHWFEIEESGVFYTCAQGSHRVNYIPTENTGLVN